MLVKLQKGQLPSRPDFSAVFLWKSLRIIDTGMARLAGVRRAFTHDEANSF